MDWNMGLKSVIVRILIMQQLTVCEIIRREELRATDTFSFRPMHEYISTTGPMKSNGLNDGEISREETTPLSVRPPFCGNRKRKTNLFASSILADVCSSTAGGTTLKKPEALSTVSMLDPPTCKFCVCEYSRVLHKVPPLSSFGHREQNIIAGCWGLATKTLCKCV